MNITRTVLANIANSTKPVGCAAVKEDKRPFSFARLEEKCGEHGIDPLDILFLAMKGKNLEGESLSIKDLDRLRVEIAAKLLPHRVARLEAVEHSGPNGNPLENRIEVVIVDPKTTDSEEVPAATTPKKV